MTSVREPMRLGVIHEVQRDVPGDADALYRLVSDVRRTGEWSPECRRARWLRGATGPAVGARFRGVNRAGLFRWSRECEVIVAEPGVEFAFRTIPTRVKPDSTVWRFRFERIDGGSRIRHSYEIARPLPMWVQSGVIAPLTPHHFDMRPHMSRTLERLDELSSGTDQVLLPGQAAAPDGPVDLIGMYVVHHAFRRDLAAFERAIPVAPLDDRPAWAALERRWERFAHILHTHHTGEDAGLWPLLLERASPDGVATLDAMQAEHAEVDPLLEAVADGLHTLAARPDAAARDALAADVGALRERLGAHLAHEERDAMELVQRYLSESDWMRIEKENFADKYRPSDIPFALPWALDGLPADVRRRMLASAGGRPAGLVSRWLLEPRYRRGEAAVFRRAA